MATIAVAAWQGWWQLGGSSLLAVAAAGCCIIYGTLVLILSICYLRKPLRLWSQK
jgi:hypothetical protein